MLWSLILTVASDGEKTKTSLKFKFYHWDSYFGLKGCATVVVFKVGTVLEAHLA
jgi:hypothetical protein